MNINIDTLIIPVAISRAAFSPSPTPPGFDQARGYFYSFNGGKVKVTFEGAGIIDVFFGQFDPTTGGWVTGTTSEIVEKQTIPATKTFEFEMPPGHMFEPRVYKDQPGITGIRVQNPILTQVAGVATAVIGAVGGGVAGYVLKPLDPLVSALIGAGLGAGLGVGVGAAVGLLDIAGVIPVTVLGVAREESVAPAQLGKYLITG